VSNSNSHDRKADPSRTIGGGTGKDVTAWSRPDIVVAAPGGIFTATPASMLMAAGNTFTQVASQDINHVAGANYATAVAYGLVFYTYGKATDPQKPNQEIGIVMHAASGNVHVEAQSAAVKLTADKAVGVSSTSGMVRIIAPKGILLTAAGAAIDMQPDSITLKGPGKIEFKANMKVLEGPGSASASADLKTSKLADCLSNQQAASAAQAGSVRLG
jgi:type VI secretion system secreted protein VgrG